MGNLIRLGAVKQANETYFKTASFAGDDTNSYKVVYFKKLPWLYFISGWDDMERVHVYVPINQNNLKLGFTVQCDPKEARQKLLGSVYYDNLKY